MQISAARLFPLLAASLLTACAEFASADWPDLAEGFEYEPTKPRAALPAPQAPPAGLTPAEIADALAEGRTRLKTSKSEFVELMAEYEAAFAAFKAQAGEVAERAWLSAQLALSRVSQAADSLTLLAIDLRRTVVQAGESGAGLAELLSETEVYKAEFDKMLITERARLEARRPT